MLKPPPVRRALSLLDIRNLQRFANTANLWSAQLLVKCRYVIAPISFRHRAYHASAISSGSSGLGPEFCVQWSRPMGFGSPGQAHLASAMAAASRPKPAPRLRHLEIGHAALAAPKIRSRRASARDLLHLCPSPMLAGPRPAPRTRSNENSIRRQDAVGEPRHTAQRM
jgi:hypothetical protein